ncbi:MAG TPA: ABC transporter substrate-binding protein [Acidimicrobiales bacterium]|nr:ABC transporter substrate-binding protein [Acidimicrobiales bacterium]
MHGWKERAHGVACGLAAVGLAAIGGVAIASPQSGAATTHSVVTWAEPPSSVPNYILPFYGGADDTILNLYDFQSLMFRPLYYFGGKTQTEALNPTISIAQPPRYSDGDKKVTVVLKNYRWSNGTKLDDANVMLWFNMLHAEKTNYGNYFPGGLSIPTTIASVTVKNPTTLVFTLTRPVNPNWFTNDQLWEPVPMPLAWTKTSTNAPAGSGGCGSAPYGTSDAKCAAVYRYLSEQAGFTPTHPSKSNDALPTYATNPLWQVVDGPFHLTSYTVTGLISMAPNPSYSGPNKPKYKKFVEKPYTTSSAEYDALVSGQIDVGYLPTADITSNAHTPVAGGPNNPRLTSDFDLVPWNGFQISFTAYNFKSNGDGGEASKIFSQLYFRQAMQRLIDQPLYIKAVAKGYAAPDYGPVPILPKNPYTSKLEASNPYPYNPSKATALLRSHGWKIVPGGTDTCAKPGTGKDECGAGISEGAKLSFDMLYLGGTPELKTLVTAQFSSWSKAGIQVSPRPESFDSVVGTATPCPKGCSWELADWGGYTDTGFPTEPVVFSTGAYTNYGSYSTAKADSLIRATQLTDVTLTAMENYLSEQLPVMWEPKFPVNISEIHKGLKGVLPLDPIGSITPASWYWSS